jgi:hypothetical protein
MVEKELNVKKGDKVFVYYKDGAQGISIVENVTRSGKIRVDGKLYRKDGKRDKKYYFRYSFIGECSEEDEEEFHRDVFLHKARKKISGYIARKLTYDKAVKILELFEGEEDGEASQQVAQ